MFQSTLRCGALGCVIASAFASMADAQLLSHKDLQRFHRHNHRANHN